MASIDKINDFANVKVNSDTIYHDVVRVLTWTCCAFLLMLLMFTVLILMVYGISVGYHYAQKELASFAMVSRSTPASPKRRSGGDDEQDSKPIVRLVAVNRSAVDHPQKPILEAYRNRNEGEKIFLEQKPTPIVVLETERPPAQPVLMPHEKELAKQLIGRFRRSKNVTTVEPFLIPLKDHLPLVAG